MKTLIIAAGFGSRLWPLSTSEHPKQFQKLFGEQSLLQYTYQSLAQSTPLDELYVLTLRGLDHFIYEQLPDIDSRHVIIVPERRNTLPHITFALRLITASPDELVLVRAVDQLVSEPQDLQKAIGTYVEHNAEEASKHITLFCPRADAPDPSLGYAEVDGDYRVTRFIEKPSTEELQKLMDKRNLYVSWFVFVLSRTSLSEALPHGTVPEVEKLLTASKKELPRVFMEMPFIDISTAVFQHAKNIFVVPIGSSFDDVGTYAALHKVLSKDKCGNVIIGNVTIDDASTDNFIVNQLSQPLIVFNTRGSVVVQTESGTVISPIDDVDQVGEVYKKKIQSH